MSRRKNLLSASREYDTRIDEITLITKKLNKEMKLSNAAESLKSEFGSDYFSMINGDVDVDKDENNRVYDSRSSIASMNLEHIDLAENDDTNYNHETRVVSDVNLDHERSAISNRNGERHGHNVSNEPNSGKVITQNNVIINDVLDVNQPHSLQRLSATSTRNGEFSEFFMNDEPNINKVSIQNDNIQGETTDVTQSHQSKYEYLVKCNGNVLYGMPKFIFLLECYDNMTFRYIRDNGMLDFLLYHNVKNLDRDDVFKIIQKLLLKYYNDRIDDLTLVCEREYEIIFGC